MKKLIFLSIVLRILISAFYFHPDIKTINYQASFLRKGVVNIYTYLNQNKKSLPLKDEFVYFPLTYFAFGGYQAIVSPILGSGFDSWLANSGVNSFVKDPGVFRYLVVLKLPYLAIDLLIGYLIFKYFKDAKLGSKAMTIWLFNPFTIILIYVFSNVDVIPALLTLVSFLLIKQKKFTQAAVVLGAAASFKLYPLIFLPFLSLSGSNLKQRIKLFVLPLFVTAVVVAPFLSGAFVNSALISGLTTRIFYPGFNIGFNESIIIGLSVLTGLFLASLYREKTNLFNYWLVVFLVIFAFAHFHIQWLVWVAPFLVIYIVKNPKVSWLVGLIALLAFTIPFLYDDRSMTISTLRVYSTFYDVLPSPFAILMQLYDPYNLQSIIHSVLAGAIGVFSFKLITDKT